MTFGARLHAAVERLGPLCVGVDPHPGLLLEWGLRDDPDGLARFCAVVAEAFAGRSAIVKPQSAFFERHGSRGIAVLEQTIADYRAAGTLVLLDVKRGDIGSTSQAYADAYLDATSPLAVDAITASPYLGLGSLTPMIDTARRHEAGVFVLALTSNPEGGQVQRATAASGAMVAEEVLAGLRALNADAEPLGSFGAVVGATVTDWPGSLEINGPLLAPGVGAQGGTAAAVRDLFGPAAASVLPSVSRSVLRAGPSVDALRAAADEEAAGFRPS